MRKSPIKVKIEKINSALSGSEPYRIAQISGAITIWTGGGGIESRLRVGDYINETQAEKLLNSYLVTVVAK